MKKKIIILMLMFMASTCFGTTFFVDGGAGGADDGSTLANAWLTISQAIDSASTPGNTIQVTGDQTYDETLDFVSPTHNSDTFLLVVDPASTAAPIIKRSAGNTNVNSGAVYVNNATSVDITFTGFSLGKTGGRYTFGSATGASGTLRLVSCILDNDQVNDAICIFQSSSMNIVIDGCTVPAANGVFLNVFSGGVGNISIINGTTINAPSGTGGGAILNLTTGAVGDITITDSTFSRSATTAAESRLILQASSGTVTAMGDVFVDNNTCINMQAGVNIEEFATSVWIGNNNIEIDNGSVAGFGIKLGRDTTSREFSRLAFTSGGGAYEVKVGDVITGQTSAKTATVTIVEITSGTLAGGNAVGTLSLSGQNGAFTAGGETFDVGANADVLEAALDAAAYNANPLGKCTIFNNRIEFTGADNDHGIFTGMGTESATIKGNYVTGADFQIVIKSDNTDVIDNIAWGTKPLTISSCNSGTVTGNTLFGVSDVAFQYKDTSGNASFPGGGVTQDLRVWNNIFVTNSSAVAISTDSGTTNGNIWLDYNCYFNTSGNIGAVNNDTQLDLAALKAEWVSWSASPYGVVNDLNSVQINPQFVNATNGDFRLKATSPLLNIGNPTGVDEAGNPTGKAAIGGWQPFALPQQEYRARQSGSPLYR